jgi:hypothetical protein
MLAGVGVGHLETDVVDALRAGAPGGDADHRRRQVGAGSAATRANEGNRRRI